MLFALRGATSGHDKTRNSTRVSVGAVESGDVLVLVRDEQAGAALECGLRTSYQRDRVHRVASIEMALRTVARHHITAAFLDCDLPDAIFNKIRQGGPRGVQVRVIGVRRGRSTLQAIRLVSRRLISAYVSLPATLASLDALLRSPRRMPSSTSVRDMAA